MLRKDISNVLIKRYFLKRPQVTFHSFVTKYQKMAKSFREQKMGLIPLFCKLLSEILCFIEIQSEHCFVSKTKNTLSKPSMTSTTKNTYS